MKNLMKMFRMFGVLPIMSLGFAGEGEGGGEEPEVPENPEVEPEIPETPEEPEVPEHLDPKRVYGENRRMSEKMQKLEAELAEMKGKIPTPTADKLVDILQLAMQDPEVAKDIARYKERFGADDDDCRSMLRISGYGAKRTVDSAMSPINDSMAESTLDKVLNEHKKDPELKVVIEKYGSEVKQFLVDKKVSRQFWGNPEFIYNVIGGVVAKHLKELKGEGTKKIDRVVLGEQGGGTKTQGAAGIDWESVKAYASEIGYSEQDLTDKEVKKKVLEAYKAQEGYKKS